VICPECQAVLDPNATRCLDCGKAIAPARHTKSAVRAGVPAQAEPLLANQSAIDQEVFRGRDTEWNVGNAETPSVIGSGRNMVAPDTDHAAPEIKGSIVSGADDLINLATKHGYELVGMVGLSQHGKSEFMYSFLKAMARRRGRDSAQGSGVLKYGLAEKVERTPPGVFYGWRIPVDDRLFAIWDVAGEDFEKVADQRTLNVSGDIRRFLCRVLPHCRGLILTIALPKLWAAWNDQADQAQIRQTRREKLDSNVNAYVRFLEFAQVARSVHRPGAASHASSDDYLNDEEVRRQLRHARPLDIPVVINLSMADACMSLKTPEEEAPRDRGFPLRNVPSMRVNSEDVDPLMIGYLHMQPLFNHLVRNVRWFKFDFSHAYNSGDIERRPEERREVRGCESMHMFLTEMNWAGRFMSTGTYLRWYRRLRPRQWAARLQKALEQ
jgi:hypothetical protein